MSYNFREDAREVLREGSLRTTRNKPIHRLAATTAHLEHVEPVADEILRVVARFNQEPSVAECQNKFNNFFADKMEPVESSFMFHDDFYRDYIISGYMRTKVDKLPKRKAKNMVELVKSNAYMDEADQTIWKVDDDGKYIVRNMTESLDELIDIAEANLKPSNRMNPITVEASIPNFGGPDNTQYVYYVDPVIKETEFGIRLDDDHVLCRSDQAKVEIASNLVIAIHELRKMDQLPDELARIDKSDANQLIQYYKQVYGFNPGYFDDWEDMIREKTLA